MANDAVKAYLIPPELTPAQVSFAYASEAAHPLTTVACGCENKRRRYR